MSSAVKCENCGADSTGSVNGRAFCSAPTCISAVMGSALAPVRDAYKDATAATSNRPAPATTDEDQEGAG